MEEKISEAIKAALEAAPERKFVESVDISFTIKDVDLKNPTNRIKEEIRLPSGRGRELKVAMFAAGVGRHPFKVPTELSSAGVGGAVGGRGVDLNARSWIHQGALVNDDVETAVEGLRTPVEVDADGINDARHVRRREVVGGAHAVVAVGVAGATGSGLTVLS